MPQLLKPDQSSYRLFENHQTGSNYPIVAGDCGKVLYLDNAAAQTPTIPVSGSTGFTTGWYVNVCNIGAGVQTLKPESGTIGGVATKVIAAGFKVCPSVYHYLCAKLFWCHRLWCFSSMEELICLVIAIWLSVHYQLDIGHC